MRRCASRPAVPLTEAILTVPSFSMSIVAPVSSVIWRMTAPPLPMTSRIFSGSILIVMIDGAHSRHLRARLGEDLVHLAEDVQPAFARLLQRDLHDLAA